MKFLQYIWKKLYCLAKVTWEFTEQHNGGKTFKGSFGSDDNEQRSPEVRYLETGVKVLPKVIYLRSMNIYLEKTENLGTFEGILGTLFVLGTCNNPQCKNT